MHFQCDDRFWRDRNPGICNQMMFAIEAVSEIAFAENHHFPAPKGCADFQRLPPFREGVRRR
jgi:hypothetical protein